ncbi:MAG: hypothetical protein AAF802_15350, partial [Planctomycetota bacterium]
MPEVVLSPYRSFFVEAVGESRSRRRVLKGLIAFMNVRFESSGILIREHNYGVMASLHPRKGCIADTTVTPRSTVIAARSGPTEMSVSDV